MVSIDAYLSGSVGSSSKVSLLYVARHHVRILVLVPFGLSSSHRVFTKLLKPVLARLCQQGACVIMYLDDMLLMAQSKDNLERQTGAHYTATERLGLCGQQKEISLAFYPVTTISGLPSQLPRDVNQVNRREDSPDEQTC